MLSQLAEETDYDNIDPVRGAGMSQPPKKAPRKTAIKRGETASPSQAELDEVLALIDAAKARAVAVVNTALIDLY